MADPTGAGAIDRKAILLVEDERELRDSMARGLRRAGYLVDVGATAAEAQQLLGTLSYALVIADWCLPDGNGIDLANRAAKLRARTLILRCRPGRLSATGCSRHRRRSMTL